MRFVQVRTLSDSAYQNIKVETHGRVGIITLHRPKALNALCDALLDEVIRAGKKFVADDNIGCIVITGSEKAFAAGADIKEMKERSYTDCYKMNLFSNWTEVAKFSKPVRGELGARQMLVAVARSTALVAFLLDAVGRVSAKAPNAQISNRLLPRSLDTLLAAAANSL